jgi:hypothetical protein
MNIIWLTVEETNIWVILRYSGKYEATKEDKYWRYLEKVNSWSLVNMVAWVKYKDHKKDKMVVLSKLNARLHVVIDRGHKDECRLYGP